MNFLVLLQQKFSPVSCHPQRIVYYGDPLFLSFDLSYFIYRDVKYNIKLNRIENQRGLYKSIARSGIRGSVDVDARIYIYDIDVPEKMYFKIVQMKDVNTYLHDKYEISYVIFAGMRFEMVYFGGAAPS